jgi:hypothetical protein
MSDKKLPDWDQKTAYLMSLAEDSHYWQDPPIQCPNKVTVWRATQGKLRYKAEFILRAERDEIVALLSTPERRTEWDGACELAEVVGGDGECRAVYLKTKSSWPTSPREEVIWMTKRRVGESGVLLLTTTCEAFPVRGKGVKMITDVGGQLISPHEEGGCKVTMLMDNDPGGSLSAKMINQISTKRVPKNIERIRRILESS